MANNSPNAAYGRYMRLMGGETAEEIAERDGVSLATVEKSLTKGAELENQRTALKVMRLRDEGAVENEQFRKQVRNEFFGKAKEAIDILLKGENVAIETDRATGKITLHKYSDPKMLAEGLNQLRRFASLEEKPSVPTTIINNVQQNNTANIGADSFDFEKTLGKIREKQVAARPDVVIDVEANESGRSEDAMLITAGAPQDQDWSNF